MGFLRTLSFLWPGKTAEDHLQYWSSGNPDEDLNGEEGGGKVTHNAFQMFELFVDRKPLNRYIQVTLANSEDPDEMAHNQKKKYIFVEIIINDPSTYTMDNPDFMVCGFMENSIGLKKVKTIILMQIVMIKIRPIGKW